MTLHKMSHLNLSMQEQFWTSLNDTLCASSSEMTVIWILFSIEFLAICLTLYGLCSMLRSGHTLPIFVVNLFVCDVIQICIKPFLHFCDVNLLKYVYSIYLVSLINNVGFMVCISMERYIMIKYPVWYRFHSKSRNSFLICLLVWVIETALMVIYLSLEMNVHMEHAKLYFVVLHVVPYPVVLFSFVGSWRALSHLVKFPADEKKRILCILALVLFNYTVLFFPSIVQSALFYAYGPSGYNRVLFSVSLILLYLNPLVDCLLYFFIRKDATSLLRCVCCKNPQENQV